MKPPGILLLLPFAILISMASCSGIPKRLSPIGSSEAISVAEVAKRSGELDGNKVKVIGLFDAHHDGSSLRDIDNDKTWVLVPYLGVNYLVSSHGWGVGVDQFLRWQDQPVVVQGKYVIGSITHMGHTIKNVTMIVPDRIDKISSKEVRLWFKSKNGEQCVAPQSATRFEAESEGSNKPQTESEGSSR